MIDYSELNELLLDRLPELRAGYEELHADEVGPHLVYGGLLQPAIVDYVRAGNTVLLARIFNFLEEVVSNGSPWANDVIALSVLGPLVSEQGVVPRVWRLMGPATRALAKGSRIF